MTGRYLGERSLRARVLRAEARIDRMIDRAPRRARQLLRRILYGGVMRVAFRLSGGTIQT